MEVEGVGVAGGAADVVSFAPSGLGLLSASTHALRRGAAFFRRSAAGEALKLDSGCTIELVAREKEPIPHKLSMDTHRSETVAVLRYVGFAVMGIVVGAIAGSMSGFLLGTVMGLGYHRHGPSDPGDAPVYVTLGLMVLGAYAGAVGGFVIGIFYSVRFARRAKLERSA